MTQILYGCRDVEPGEVLRSTLAGWCVESGGTTYYFRFSGLTQYADWLEKNADHFPSPELAKAMAVGIRQRGEST